MSKTIVQPRFDRATQRKTLLILLQNTKGTLSSGTIADTARRRSTRQESHSNKKGRLSSIFTASPKSVRSQRRCPVTRRSRSSHHHHRVHSIASRSASEAESDAETERSREPSMILADDEDISFSRPVIICVLMTEAASTLTGAATPALSKLHLYERC